MNERKTEKLDPFDDSFEITPKIEDRHLYPLSCPPSMRWGEALSPILSVTKNNQNKDDKTD